MAGWQTAWLSKLLRIKDGGDDSSDVWDLVRQTFINPETPLPALKVSSPVLTMSWTGTYDWWHWAARIEAFWHTEWHQEFWHSPQYFDTHIELPKCKHDFDVVMDTSFNFLLVTIFSHFWWRNVYFNPVWHLHRGRLRLKFSQAARSFPIMCVYSASWKGSELIAGLISRGKVVKAGGGRQAGRLE